MTAGPDPGSDTGPGPGPDQGGIQVLPVPGLPEIARGDDVARLIADAALAEGGPGLQAGDILVVTSKAVSKAEGRVVSASREDAIAA